MLCGFDAFRSLIFSSDIDALVTILTSIIRDAHQLQGGA